MDDLFAAQDDTGKRVQLGHEIVVFPDFRFGMEKVGTFEMAWLEVLLVIYLACQIQTEDVRKTENALI